MANLTINGKTFDVDVEPDTPLLWVIRDNVGLTGTKYGCGIAQCGACTVHIDGVAMRSCGVPVGDAAGKQITTIEGLAPERRAAQGAAGLDRQRRAAMRLLPERHDHGGGGAAQGPTRSRPTPTSTTPSPISAAAAPSSRCARRSTPPRTPEGGSHEPYARNSTAAPSSSAPPRSAAGLALGFDLPFGGPTAARAADGSRRKSTPGS